MNHKLLSLLVSVAFLAGGCVLQGRGKTVAYAIDGGMVLGGGLIMIGSQGSDCGSDVLNDPNYAGCKASNAGAAAGTVVGGTLLAAGLVGLVATLVLDAADDDSSATVAASVDGANHGADFTRVARTTGSADALVHGADESRTLRVPRPASK